MPRACPKGTMMPSSMPTIGLTSRSVPIKFCARPIRPPMYRKLQRVGYLNHAAGIGHATGRRNYLVQVGACLCSTRRLDGRPTVDHRHLERVDDLDLDARQLGVGHLSGHARRLVGAAALRSHVDRNDAAGPLGSAGVGGQVVARSGIGRCGQFFGDGKPAERTRSGRYPLDRVTSRALCAGNTAQLQSGDFRPVPAEYWRNYR